MKTFGGPGDDRGIFVQQTTDDGYITTKATSRFDACYDIMLIKTNKTGALSDPPNTPTITGKANGKIGILYNYTIQTTHPEQLNVEYFIVWGDNSTSGWIGPYESGEKVIVYHLWNEKGTYTIKVKAQDLYGAESG
jgi:hypothetical protein